LLGQKVRVLVDESLNTGIYEVEIDSHNLTSGKYFYQMISGGFMETKKMILIKWVKGKRI